MSSQEERVGEHLNAALASLLAQHERLHLLGEDLADPYGGAFKISRGLSSRFPGRVISTPISESALLGVANGLALAGCPVIAELMFGDFIALAFDQLLNFTAKSVTMFGRRVPLPIVVRCPVGGNRGYGPTHSQSPQKHLIGIPQLRLCEVSPFHDVQETIGEALGSGQPCVLFEDKVLYTRRMLRRPLAGHDFAVESLPGPGRWVRVTATDGDAPDVVLIVPGGMSYSALESARELRSRHALRADILVPAQLYPFEPGPVLALVGQSGLVCVAEEGTAGGTWGAEVAAALHSRLWGRLSAPVELVSSVPSVIPAAPHLERLVLVQPATITQAVLRLAARQEAPPAARAGMPAEQDPAAGAPHMGTDGPGLRAEATADARPRAAWPITIPSLNSNDADCLLVEWLVADGELVTAGTLVATVETSKASHDIEAGQDGVLRHARVAGDTCGFGEAIGYLHQHDPAAPAGSVAPGGAARQATSRERVQNGVAATVTRSHLTIPAAFVTATVCVDPAADYLAMLSDADEAAVDLPALLVKAIGSLRAGFPGFFGSVSGEGELTPADQADVSVTVDAGRGLFTPVIKDVERLRLPDVADELVSLKISAVTGGYTSAQLTPGAIGLSVNLVEGIDLVQPLVLPPQAAMVSVGAPRAEVHLRADGTAGSRNVVTIGLAHDHRVINGRDAALFLAALKDVLEHPGQLGPLLQVDD